MVSVFQATRKMRMQAFALLSVLGLAACDPSMMGGPISGLPGAGSGDTVKVALLVPRGSVNAGDDIVSQSLENAARLAAADLSGVTVELEVYATAGNAATAATAAVEAVSNGADIVLGPLFSEAANSVGVALSNTSIPILAFSNNPAIAGGNVFVLGNTFQNTADRLIDYASRQGLGNVYVVHAQNVSGDAGRNAVETAVFRQGMSLAGSTSYEFSQSGVVTASAEVSIDARATGADAVFLTSDAAGALPLFAQLLPEQGLTADTIQYIGLTRWDIPQIQTLPAIQGAWFTVPDPGRATGFSTRYQETYGSAPHPLAGLAYDGVAAIGAIAAADLPVTTQSLTQGAGFQGTGGVFRFRADGTNQRGLAVATILEGNLVILEGAPQSFDVGGF